MRQKLLFSTLATASIALATSLLQASPALADTIDLGTRNVKVCVGKTRRVLRLEYRADGQYTINGRQGTHSIFSVTGATGAARCAADVDTTKVKISGLQ